MPVLDLSLAVRIAILASGLFLWLGMLTGIWKYLQIRRSPQSRAHYYVDIAHRSSLLYAPAALILAVMAHISVFSALVNLIAVLCNLVFFSFSILMYILHGILQDTQNQFKKPYSLGVIQLPVWLIHIAMWMLIVAEVGATGVLVVGAGYGLFGLPGF